jgi:hypothetical protein
LRAVPDAADPDFERVRAPGEADFGRRRAALFACRESAVEDTTDFGSRCRAFFTARLRRAEVPRGLRSPCPTSYARSADSRVRFEVCPRLGGGSGTPALRAFDRPIAIACLVDRAPCLPSRTCSISSCTNSPAAVVGLLPARRSFWAFLSVFFSGMPAEVQEARLPALTESAGVGAAAEEEAAVAAGPRSAVAAHSAAVAVSGAPAARCPASRTTTGRRT